MYGGPPRPRFPPPPGHMGPRPLGRVPPPPSMYPPGRGFPPRPPGPPGPPRPMPPGPPRRLPPPPAHYPPYPGPPRYTPPPTQFMRPGRPMMPGPPPPYMGGPPRNGAAPPPAHHEDVDEDMQEEEEDDDMPMEMPMPTGRPQPFDLYMCDKELWQKQTPNEEKFAKALITRNQQITPADSEQAGITSLMTRVKGALEMIAASDLLSSAKIDEFREVGSFKKGTMLARKNTADLVVFFKTLPAPENVKLFGDKVVELLKTGEHRNEIFGVVPRPYGCEIAGTKAVIRILIAIPADQIPNLDPGLHLKQEIIEANLAALRHAIWFDEHAGQPAIKILVRLVKDIKQRCAGLAALDVWTIELLSHYCVACTPDREPLTLTHAFRRFFQLIASGFLLHSSVGVADPCDQNRRINYGFDPTEADLICRTAQFIVRLLMHERYDRLFLVKSVQRDIAVGNEIDLNLNIAPLKEAYSKDLIVNEPPKEHFFSRVAA